jgi:phosphohistidine phosphatase
VELILWRHAEALDSVPDSERCLSERGRKQAKHMAEWLKPRLTSELAIIVSPATRTQQTAQALSKHFLTSAQIGVGASVTSFIQAVNWPQADGMVIAVGHQPTLGRAAAYLLSGKEDEWDIKKGAIWWFSYRPEEGGNHALLKACLSPNLV